MVKDEGLWDGLFASVACCEPSQKKQDTVLVELEQNPMTLSESRRGVPVNNSNKWPQWRSRQQKSPSSSAEAQEAQKSSAGNDDVCHSDSKKVLYLSAGILCNADRACCIQC